jgi:hypothetical protein
MKSLAIGIKLLLGSFLLGFVGNTLATTPFPRDVAQIDSEGFSCPAPSSVFNDIPGLVLTMETSGKPVQVSFTATVDLSSNSIIQLRPVIDGRAQDDKFVTHNSGANNGIEISLSMSRVFRVTKGVHTFGVQAACPSSGGTVHPFRMWLTVYEVGSDAQNRGDDNRNDGNIKSPFSRP